MFRQSNLSLHTCITQSRTYRYPSIYWCVWSSTRIHQRQWGKSLSIFHCFMRKQNTKIHTDFELSICRLHPSVFISLYNMQHLRYTLQTPMSQMLSNYCPICFCCIFGTVSDVVFVLTFCHPKPHLPFVLRHKISTWTTGTSLSWSTMKNKMTKARESYCKCYELLLVCRSFSYAFHPLAWIVQVEFQYNHYSSRGNIPLLW